MYEAGYMWCACQERNDWLIPLANLGRHRDGLGVVGQVELHVLDNIADKKPVSEKSQCRKAQNDREIVYADRSRS